MSQVIQFRAITERDEENIEFLLSVQPHMNVSEALRWLLEDYRRRHDGDTRESKDHKLDELREASGVIDRKLTMLMRHSGLSPYPDCAE